MSCKHLLAAVIACLLLAGPAFAIVASDVLDYEVRLPQSQVAPTYTFPTDQEAEGMLPAFAAFRTGEGSGWKLLQWNPALGTPSAMGGPAIPLVGTGASEEAVRAAVEAFVARNASLVKADPRDLRIADVVDLGNERTYVIMGQFADGFEVVQGRLDIGLWRGQVVFIGSDLYQNVSVERFPALDATAAANAAHLGIPSSQGDAVQGEPRLVVLPMHREAGPEYHLAWEVMLKTAAPEGLWRTYVDAGDGSILWRQDEYAYFQITGNVQGKIEENFGWPYFDGAMEDERVKASGTYTGYTNEAGDYVIEVPNNTNYSVVADLNGLYCNVNDRLDNVDAVLTQNGAPGTPVNFLYDDTNSDKAERDAWFHVNLVHDWIKGLDPTFNDLDYAMNANVNLTTGTCNAFWNGSSVNFYYQGGGCNSTGRISDVIYHEYGHGITQEIYSPQSPPTGSGMGEGISDVVSMSIHDDPIVGEYFYQNGGSVRNGMNLRQYPGTECAGEVHCLGEIFMGANWKTQAAFDVKYGTAQPAQWGPLFVAAWKTKQTSMPNFLNRLLMANDTDGNLANGTKDWYEICDAYAQHNLPCPPLTNYVTISASELDDQTNDVGGYAVTAVATAVGGGAIDPSKVKIYYTADPLDGNPTWLTVTMNATGNPNEYTGQIPNQGCGKHVKYYVRAEKFTGEFNTAPPLAPYRNYYQFATGAYDVALDDNLETDQGWTIGAAGDNATQGIWERADPQGKFSDTWGFTQPENDHTDPVGTNCFVTDSRGGAWSVYDVDGGRTTILSPVFDWSTRTGIGSIRFWSFFFDYQPTDDQFRWSVSNDGGTTWTDLGHVEGMNQNDWIFHKTYFSDDQVAFTNQMRFRFQMEDVNTATTCAEAAVDDIVIRVNDCVQTGVDDGLLPLSFQVDQNRPNPFNPRTSIRFGLPAAGRVSVDLFDASGRKIRTLIDERRDAGFHTVVWDGRDAENHPVGSGVYYYTVKSGELKAGHKMMLLK